MFSGKLVATIFLLSTASSFTCYYERLGLPHGACPQEVKRAYRMHALLVHPDKQPMDSRDQATQKFQQLLEAYEALSDEESRKKYRCEKISHRLLVFVSPFLQAATACMPIFDINAGDNVEQLRDTLQKKKP